jgi:hypothetical protein
MNLTSGISKRFKKPFVLDEDSLRRFHAIIEKSATDLSFSTKVVFHVEREDYRYYETDNIEEIFSDPNIIGKRINELSVELHPENAENTAIRHIYHSDIVYARLPDWTVMIVYSLREKDISFPNPDMVRLRIATHDKNWALLLADEIEPQIQRTFKAKQTPRWLLWLFVVPFLFLLANPIHNVAAPYRKNDISTFLLALLVVASLMIFVFRHNIATFVTRFLGPESVFLWGEEAQSYSSREQVRRSILWGVIVAFLVSFFASLIISIGPIFKKNEQAPVPSNKAAGAATEGTLSAAPIAVQYRHSLF